MYHGTNEFDERFPKQQVSGRIYACLRADSAIVFRCVDALVSATSRACDCTADWNSHWMRDNDKSNTSAIVSFALCVWAKPTIEDLNQSH